MDIWGNRRIRAKFLDAERRSSVAEPTIIHVKDAVSKASSPMTAAKIPSHVAISSQRDAHPPPDIFLPFRITGEATSLATTHHGILSIYPKASRFIIVPCIQVDVAMVYILEAEAKI